MQELLQLTQTVYFATCDGQRPCVRPLTLIVLDGVQYIATGTSETKMKQLAANPRIEWCLPLREEGVGNGYLRGRGEAEVVTDDALRAEVHRRVSFIAEYFPQPSDPEFALLRLRISHYEYMKPGEQFATHVSA